MKVLIPIVIGLLVVGCGKKQFTNTNEGNSTPIKTAKKNVEKETPTSTSWISDPSDPNNVKIEAAIRKKLKKPTGEFTKADLEKVTFLNLVYNQLTDVTALKELTQLTRLLLSGNRLTDVTALKELTQLTELHLGSNQLTEVPSGLEKLTQLTRLDLNSNQLTDVTALKELTPHHENPATPWRS